MTFNVEEMYLIRILDHRTRRALLEDLKQQLKVIADPDLLRLCARTYRKTAAMKDQEFEDIDFAAIEEDEEIE
ncbi:MAG: transposon-transfer assisting family protein [Eubacterium sp.]